MTHDLELAAHLRDAHGPSVAEGTDAEALADLHASEHDLFDWDHEHGELLEDD